MNCEHCQKLMQAGELLGAVDYWIVSKKDGRRIPSYWWVCDDCCEKRHEWCCVFPDHCENCGDFIPPGDHCLEKSKNRDGDYISSSGLAAEETCRIVCEACYDRGKTD